MTTDRPTLDVAAHPQGLPDPRPRGQRQRRSSTSTRPPRRRSRGPCSTRWTRYYETHQRQRAPRRLPASPTRPPTRYEGGPRQGARFISARSDARDRVHQERHRGAQPGRPLVGPGQPARGRRRACSPRWSTTPTSCRGTCWRPSGASSCAGSRSPTTASSTSPTSTGCSTAPRLFGFTAMSNVLGTHHPGAPARRRRPRRRRRSPSSTPASTCPTSPTDVQAMGADFLAFSGHKMCGPDRHRRAVGPRGAARRHAAVPRRRRDDPRRPPRRLHAGRRSREVRGRHAADRRGHRLGAAVDYLDALGMDAVRAPRDGPHRLRHRRRSTERFGDDITHPRARTNVEAAAACCRSPSATSTPTTSPRCSTRPTCACAPATTAPSRSCGCSASAPPPGPASTSTTTTADVDALADALDAADRLLRLLDRAGPRRTDHHMPGLEDLYREIILDHYRNPRNRGELPTPPAVRSRGLQPAVRRRDRRLPRRRRRRRSTTSASAARAARSASPRRR